VKLSRGSFFFTLSTAMGFSGSSRKGTPSLALDDDCLQTPPRAETIT
jgi:hypothetical protein